MLISRNLHNKSSEVSIKTRSTPASLSFKGQATKHTTVKWSISLQMDRCANITWHVLFSITAKVRWESFCCKSFHSECYGWDQQGTAKIFVLVFKATNSIGNNFEVFISSKRCFHAKIVYVINGITKLFHGFSCVSIKLWMLFGVCQALGKLKSHNALLNCTKQTPACICNSTTWANHCNTVKKAIPTCWLGRWISKAFHFLSRWTNHCCLNEKSKVWQSQGGFQISLRGKKSHFKLGSINLIIISKLSAVE